LREIVAEIDGKLAGDFTRGGIDQDGGKGLGRGIKAKEHAGSFSIHAAFPSRNVQPSTTGSFFGTRPGAAQKRAAAFTAALE
jgi:hypothetical protein